MDRGAVSKQSRSPSPAAYNAIDDSQPLTRFRCSSRWRNFIFAGWRVEGRIKDISIIVGASVLDPDDPRTREWLFVYYRYIVAVMALQYKSIIGDFDPADPFPKMLELEMITEAEASTLKAAGSRARDTVITWLGVLPLQASNEGIVSSTNFAHDILLEKVADMRGNMMFFQCADEPGLHSSYRPPTTLRRPRTAARLPRVA